MDLVVLVGLARCLGFRDPDVGGSPAATVEVEVRLTSEDGTRQEAHAELEYLPAGATRAVGLTFDDDPVRAG